MFGKLRDFKRVEFSLLVRMKETIFQGIGDGLHLVADAIDSGIAACFSPSVLPEIKTLWCKSH